MTSDKTQSAGPDKGKIPPLLLEPGSVEETGIGMGFLSDLALKTIYFAGELSAHDIARSLCLPFANVVDRILDFLKREELVSITGSKGFDERGFQYTISSKGSARAREALGRSGYSGPAPVSLAAYTAVIKQQSIEGVVVRASDVQAALSHLVLNPKTMRKVGPAVNSGRSIFIYGPPGNGKTSIAQAIAGLLKGQVYIPYAVQVEGHVIKVYDPLNHQAEGSDGDKTPVPGEKRVDPRWVLCRRPVVIVGGELTLSSLDLLYDENAKYYEAPFQMKANGGMFMIDDFGRQQVRPQDLLNRWIVPLETRVDYLTLHTGKKIEIPFDQLIVFSTNIDPKQLVDEAFLRRIRHKIEVPDPSDAEYLQIFQRVCAARRIQFDQEAFIYLLQEHYIKQKRSLKAVHPRDIIDQIIDIAHYLGVRPALTRDLIDQACESYFVNL